MLAEGWLVLILLLYGNLSYVICVLGGLHCRVIPPIFSLSLFSLICKCACISLSIEIKSYELFF